METKKWKINPSHSEAAFQARKLMIMNVHGTFEDFEGQLETEGEDFKSLKNIQFKAKVASLKTDDEKRNTHLRSADFFDVETYPHLTFMSKSLNTKDKKIEGELSIRNFTKPVVFDVEFPEISNSEKKGVNAEMKISGKINRKDFGLVWDGTNEAGEIFVGDVIKLTAAMQFTKESVSEKNTSEQLA